MDPRSAAGTNRNPLGLSHPIGSDSVSRPTHRPGARGVKAILDDLSERIGKDDFYLSRDKAVAALIGMGFDEEAAVQQVDARLYEADIQVGIGQPFLEGMSAFHRKERAEASRFLSRRARREYLEGYECAAAGGV